MKEELINNINKIHTTKLGSIRIQKNLNIESDVVEYIKKIILDNNSFIYKNGKNYYCENNNVIVTINSYNYCIITAHKLKYICKIANIKEINTKWDYEIDNASDDKNNYIIWKKSYIERYNKGYIIPYYGILNKRIICECTAVINKSVIQNSEGLIDKDTVYLMAFRTVEHYQGKGYFRELFNYMINDLKKKGFKKTTLGVESTEIKNKSIYQKYGFTSYIKNGKEKYPDGTLIEVEYYSKDL